MKLLLIVIGLAVVLLAAWVWITQPLPPGVRATTYPQVDAARLRAHVEMLSHRFFPRDSAHPANLDRAAAYIRGEFERAGGQVSEQTYQVSGQTYRNVLAQFGPVTAQRLVVGAHYDAAGPIAAADDNASGVAGLIELANLLGRTPLAIRVELAAYTLEEMPFFRSETMGSAVHATSLKAQAVPVKAMLALEMIGYFSDAEGSQRFPLPFLSWIYPTRGNFIAVVGRLEQGMLVRRVKQAMRDASALPVYSMNAPRSLPGVDWSDHRSFWEAGYPAVMITDTAFYRNPNYHDASDRPETLDYGRMSMVVQAVYGAVLNLAR
jgi:hypothetical protein